MLQAMVIQSDRRKALKKSPSGTGTGRRQPPTVANHFRVSAKDL